MAKLPLYSIYNYSPVKRPFWPGKEVSDLDFWAPHFDLVILQGVMVGFAKTFPVLSLEGGAKFWITLY